MSGTGPARSSTPDPDRDPGTASGSVHVSPLSIPLLFLGIIVGFVAANVLLGWTAVLILAGAVGAVAVALRGGAHREAAAAGVLGMVLGALGVLLLAFLNGAI